MKWKGRIVSISGSIMGSVFLGSFILSVLAVGSAALAQTPTAVSSTFFGASTAVCDYELDNSGTSNSNTNCIPNTTTGEYPVWWPNSAVGGSSPAVTLQAEGKGARQVWFSIENDLLCLKLVKPGMQTIGHWEYDLGKTGCSIGSGSAPAFNWGYSDSYVAAAQASNIDSFTAFFKVPQYAICFDYTTSFGSGGIMYGGPNTIPTAVSCATDPTPETVTGVCPNGTSNGQGYCPGPEYDPDFGNISYFAKEVVSHYYNFGTTPTNTVAIKYFELWNEPDAANQPFWLNVSGVPDWPTLIMQSKMLEVAMNGEYTTLGVSTTNFPIFIGPGFASLKDSDNTNSMCGSTASCGVAIMCPSTSGSPAYGYLNSCATYMTAYVYGKDLQSVGTFHMYPGKEPTGDTPACQNFATGFSSYTTIECTGNNLITDIQIRLNNFLYYNTSIPTVFMDEGSWMDNVNFSPDTGAALYSDMRAFTARYSMIMAATVSSGTSPLAVSREYWDSWAGSLNDTSDGAQTGTMCDDGTSSPTNIGPYYPCYTALVINPSDHYGGYAYGQVESWIGGGKINPTCTPHTLNGVTGCMDALGSLWTYSIIEPGHSTPNALAAWIWNNTTVTCPGVSGCSALSMGSYSDYKTLEGATVTVNYPTVPITFSQEPILFEQ